MPATKRAWQITSGPMQFDGGSIYTRVEFTVTATGTKDDEEVGLFIDSARQISEGVWGFRGFLTLEDRMIWVTGIFNVREQDGNLSEE